MNMFKKNGGFTLVELIVVIAILAILAGIAVPAYSGYLQSAEKAGDITTLSAVKTAAVASVATKGEVAKIEIAATEGVVSTIVITLTAEEGQTPKTFTVYNTDEDAEALTGEAKQVADDFALYLDNVADLGFYKTGAQWPVEGEWDVYPTPTED